MPDQFTLTGSWQSSPQTSGAVNSPDTSTPLSETQTVVERNISSITLGVDTAVVLPFAGVTNAQIVIISTENLNLRAALTSVAGTTQIIPINDLLILVSRTEPITAITLTRTAGVSTPVKFYLGGT